MQRRGLVPAMLLVGSIGAGGSAIGATTSYIDLTAGAGYSSNPFDRTPAESSAFGRLSAFGTQIWRSERGTTSINGYIENTSYLNNYGSRQIFDVGAHTDQAVSPKVRLFGDLTFSGDFAGQLSNRLITVPSQPPVVEPGSPPPPNTTPDVFGLTGRQYTLTGQAGASITTSARGALSFSAGAERLMFSGSDSPADYNVFFGTVGYTHQASERTSIGGTLSVQHQEFQTGYANVVNPAFTASTRLSETLTADGGIGVLILNQHRQGFSHTSITPSFSAGLCSATAQSRICGHIARDAQSALGNAVANESGQAAVTTTLDFSYFRRLSERSTLQASISGVHYSTRETITGEKFHTDYVSAVLGYDHKIGRRLAAGVTVGARKLYRVGPDPRTDLNGQVYLRYRLGDLL